MVADVGASALKKNGAPSMEAFHGTTILSVRRGASVALGGDGQVTLGNVVVKATARKVRRLYGDKVVTLEIAPRVHVRVDRPHIDVVITAGKPGKGNASDRGEGKEK